MKKIYAILNSVIILLIIYWNYYSNTGKINGNTVGELSDKYDNLFTPAGYAFAIWGLIFLGLIALGIYLVKLAFTNDSKSEVILKIGPWLALANIANAAWLWFWLQEELGVSVAIILVILISLLTIVLQLNMQRNAVSKGIKVFIHYPIALYFGWITVATIANVTAFLVSRGWDGGPLTEIQWTIIMIAVAGILNVFVLFNRNMPVFAGVGIWALIAIAMRHWGSIPAIQWTALTWTLVLCLGIIYHGYLHRANKIKAN